MQRRALRWMALVILLLCPACIPGLYHVHDIQAAEGRVFLVVQGHGSAAPFFVSSAMNTRVLVSADMGKTWEELEDASSAHKIVSASGSCTLLLKGGELRRSTDGGQTSVPLALEGMVSGAVERDGTVAAYTEAGLFLTRDCGANWQTVAVGMLGDDEQQQWQTGVAAAAPGSGRLAFATGQGRVYSKTDAETEWTEAIVGPVHDLTYHEDRLYALTRMNTLAEISGSEVRHVYTDLSGYLARFLPCGGALYFQSGNRLYRKAGDEVREEALLSDPGWPGPAVAFERGSCRTLWTAIAQENGIRLQRLDLETGSREDIPFGVD